jgi:hypothetical protein
MKIGYGTALLVTIVGMCITAPNLAHAGFRVRVDNYANPNPIGTWLTGDKISVFVSMVYPATRSGLDMTVPNTDQFSGGHDTNKISYTNWSRSTVNWIGIGEDSGYGGTDMFGIDQVEILNDAGAIIERFGLDNSVAWCVSNDYNDGYTSDCGNEAAFSDWYFYPGGLVNS